MADAAVPIKMYDVDLEIGAGLLLPDGQAFYLGDTGTLSVTRPPVARARAPGLKDRIFPTRCKPPTRPQP